MTIFYAAVEDDPLDSGKGSHVIVTAHVGTIQGKDGRCRRMAFIGDSAWCDACKSMGVIAGGAPVRKGGRMLDLVNGSRYQAVGGDEVVCKCARHPRIVAVYGRTWMIQGNSDNADGEGRAAPRSAPPTYDEQFTLNDGNGNTLPETLYTMVLPSGELRHGTTDSEGRTARYATDAARSVVAYLGHRTKV